MRRASRTKGTKAPTQDEFQKALRNLQRRPENKHCCDCTERLPQYVNLEFNTFVCTSCSGIHRELNHRVKGISLSNFSEEEVRNIQQGGNQECNDLYLAKYDPSRDMKEPDGLDAGNRRRFMFAKYKEKRWYGTTEDLVQEIEEREAAERTKEARGTLRKKSSGRLVPKSSQPSDLVATSNIGRGTKQVTNPAKANRNSGNIVMDLLSSSPAKGVQAEQPPQEQSQQQRPLEKKEWNPFEDVEASRGQQPHPNVQSVQHPMDGGHHLVSGAAAVQPSPPFILAPPPVYQQVHHQQYQQAPQQGVVMGGEAYSSEPPSQQVQAFYGQQQQQHQVHHAPIVANNTGNAGGMVGGAVPPQPINPFEMGKTQQQSGVSYQSFTQISQDFLDNTPGSQLGSFQQPHYSSGPLNQPQQQQYPAQQQQQPTNATFGLAPQQVGSVAPTTTSRVAALEDPFANLTLNPEAGDTRTYLNGQEKKQDSPPQHGVISYTDSNSKMGTGHNTFNSELIDSTHLQAAEGGDGVFKNVDVTSKRTATTTLENPFELF
eukprot:100810_1